MSTKYASYAQVQTMVEGVVSKVKSDYALKSELAGAGSYTVKQQATAETGYAATYQLFNVVGEGASATETAVGAKINIPKDFLVKSATLETVETADVPYAGAQVGDKYIDFVINAKDASATAEHIYLPVNDLVDVYTAGNGIELTSGAFSIKIDTTNANGLATTSAGLKLNAATPSISGTGGSAGAMSAADKEKLDGADVTPYTGTGAVDVTGHVISVGAASPSTAGVGGAAGTMSAADKEKLDGADVTAYTAGNGVDITSHAVSAKIDTSNANGLDVGANGLKISTVSASTSGTGGSNGAMLATDKEKLDGIAFATDSEVETYVAGLWT